MNILFTCAGRRNYLINYFKESLGDKGKTVAIDMQLTAPSLVDADVAIQVPGVYSENYIETVKNIIIENDIVAVISLNDLELPILAANKAELETTGAKVLVSDLAVINTSFDKWKTAQFAKSIGLKHPKTYLDINKVKEDLSKGNLEFPLVIKPRWGSGSIGIEFPSDLEELDLYYTVLKKKINKTILKHASSEDLERSILIQEKINGTEYGLDVLNDFNGKYVNTFAREKLSMRSGETDKAVSIIDENIQKIGEVIGTELRHLGNLDCDIFVSDGDYYLLELNPRFGGGYPFSHEAGINTSGIYLHWLKGNTDIAHFNQYKEGAMFAKCDRLMKLN